MLSFEEKDITPSATQFRPIKYNFIVTIMHPHLQRKIVEMPVSHKTSSSYAKQQWPIHLTEGKKSLPNPSVFTLIKKNKGFFGTTTKKKKNLRREAADLLMSQPP